MKRQEALDLYAAVGGLCKYSTQAGFYLGANLNAVEPIAKEHDQFLKNLTENYATKDGEDFVFEDDNKTLKIEGQNLIKFNQDYNKYVNEEIEVKGLRAFSKNEMKTRVTRPGVKSELVTPDLPGEYLARLAKHQIITDFSE